MGLNPNTEHVELQFVKLTTFPFQRVVEIMTDHVRQLLRRCLHLSYLPYTTHQLTALDHLVNLYPTDVELVNRFKVVNQLIKEIQSKVITATTIAKLSETDGAIFKLTELAYQIPDKYYWIVASQMHHLYTQLHERAPNDTTINAVREYLKAHHLRQQDAKLDDFDVQLVDDITSLLQYQYPHPESYLAIEQAQLILNTYYTEQAASKLFVYDVRFKIAQCLEQMRDTLGIELINETKKRLSSASGKPIELSINERYNLLMRAILSYRQSPNPTLKQTVLEHAQVLLQLPYMEVSKLPDFNRTLEYVNNIRQEEVV